MRHTLIAISCAFALACCGGNAPQPVASTPFAAQAEAVVRVGEATVRATAMQTSMLSPEVATRYGISRDDRTVMLLVGVRQGSDAQETALPATITATATNLSGQKQQIVLRELRSGDLLDYIGTVETSLPDTLRFDVEIVREGAMHSTMQFSREFYPR
jgi:hypothetical protein